MKVKELKAILRDLNDNDDVLVATRYSDFEPVTLCNHSIVYGAVCIEGELRRDEDV